MVSLMDCILLHGWGVTNKIWQGFATKLNGFDNILTPCLYDVSKNLKNQGFTSIARALSKIIKKDSVVVAWSIGGLIALRLIPLTTKIKAIIFIASSPCFINQEEWPNVIQKNKLDELKNRFSENTKVALNHFSGLVATGDEFSSKINKHIRQNLAKETQKEILSCWLRETETDDQRNQFIKMEIPSNIILGQNDVLIKSRIKNQMEALNINTHCVIIENCGHAPFISKPAETNNIVYQFLNESM
jgi:pimeloyl-[acyl-carrier protein] methyl ester esterase